MRAEPEGLKRDGVGSRLVNCASTSLTEEPRLREPKKKRLGVLTVQKLHLPPELRLLLSMEQSPGSSTMQQLHSLMESHLRSLIAQHPCSLMELQLHL